MGPETAGSLTPPSLESGRYMQDLADDAAWCEEREGGNAISVCSVGGLNVSTIISLFEGFI